MLRPMESQRVEHNLATEQQPMLTSQGLDVVLSQEDLLEKEMATHSSNLDWEIPRTEEPGRLQSSGLKRHDLVTKKHLKFHLLKKFFK